MFHIRNMLVRSVYLSGNLFFFGASQFIYFANHIIHFRLPAIKLDFNGPAIIFDLDECLLNPFINFRWQGLQSLFGSDSHSARRGTVHKWSFYSTILLNLRTNRHISKVTPNTALSTKQPGGSKEYPFSIQSLCLLPKNIFFLDMRTTCV
jgi:hypothetical protein